MESLQWNFFQAIMQPGLFFGFKSQIGMKKYKVNFIGTIKLNFPTSLTHKLMQVIMLRFLTSPFLLHSKYYQFCALYLEGS